MGNSNTSENPESGADDAFLSSIVGEEEVEETKSDTNESNDELEKDKQILNDFLRYAQNIIDEIPEMGDGDLLSRLAECWHDQSSTTDVRIVSEFLEYAKVAAPQARASNLYEQDTQNRSQNQIWLSILWYQFSTLLEKRPKILKRRFAEFPELQTRTGPRIGKTDSFVLYNGCSSVTSFMAKYPQPPRLYHSTALTWMIFNTRFKNERTQRFEWAEMAMMCNDFLVKKWTQFAKITLLPLFFTFFPYQPRSSRMVAFSGSHFRGRTSIIGFLHALMAVFKDVWQVSFENGKDNIIGEWFAKAGCNCTCGTYFLLACLEYVGIFTPENNPYRIVVWNLPNHAFFTIYDEDDYMFNIQSTKALIQERIRLVSMDEFQINDAHIPMTTFWEAFFHKITGTISHSAVIKTATVMDLYFLNTILLERSNLPAPKGIEVSAPSTHAQPEVQRILTLSDYFTRYIVQPFIIQPWLESQENPGSRYFTPVDPNLWLKLSLFLELFVSENSLLSPIESPTSNDFGRNLPEKTYVDLLQYLWMVGQLYAEDRKAVPEMVHMCQLNAITKYVFYAKWTKSRQNVLDSDQLSADNPLVLTWNILTSIPSKKDTREIQQKMVQILFDDFVQPVFRFREVTEAQTAFASLTPRTSTEFEYSNHENYTDRINSLKESIIDHLRQKNAAKPRVRAMQQVRQDQEELHDYFESQGLELPKVDLFRKSSNDDDDNDNTKRPRRKMATKYKVHKTQTKTKATRQG